MSARQVFVRGFGISLADGAGIGPGIRPERGRGRSKSEPDNKIRKPVDNVRKKSPPARKAPPRGRYVDEYARPAR
jgi:hypothetical protein